MLVMCLGSAARSQALDKEFSLSHDLVTKKEIDLQSQGMLYKCRTALGRTDKLPLDRGIKVEDCIFGADRGKGPSIAWNILFDGLIIVTGISPSPKTYSARARSQACCCGLSRRGQSGKGRPRHIKYQQPPTALMATKTLISSGTQGEITTINTTLNSSNSRAPNGI